MRLSIRVIGIATAVIWVFLIIFAASAMYSMQDMKFSLGAPEVTAISDNNVVLSFPVYFLNSGLYDIGNLNLTTEAFDSHGSPMAWGSTLVVVVPHGEAVNATHMMKVNITALVRDDVNLLFNDSTLSVNENVSLNAAKVVPIKASSILSVLWGAPLSNLAFGAPETSFYNSTHLHVAVPVSFENHAFFNLTGTLKARVFTGEATSSSKCQVSLNAMQNSPCRVNLEFYVPIQTTSRLCLEVAFETEFFKYGPLVVDLGT